jgi:hypothetical protein
MYQHFCFLFLYYLRTSRVLEFTPVFLVGSVLLLYLVFCVVLLYVFTFLVQCCVVRCDFHIQTIFGSSLSPVVCRRARLIYIIFVC